VCILTAVVLSGGGNRRTVHGGERLAPTFVDDASLLQDSADGEKQ
jgi:hypothetical protein